MGAEGEGRGEEFRLERVVWMGRRVVGASKKPGVEPERLGLRGRVDMADAERGNAGEGWWDGGGSAWMP